ncbi:dTMP kinase [Candidatus Frankia alpina]|uniref:dTMP kinase n=1 Tax=Candidatus Frankia alpina TaxID=2699483 RepID=UPI0013FD02C7|nr:dTMP kinase [Candidatus Frankia alpina]
MASPIRPAPGPADAAGDDSAATTVGPAAAGFTTTITSPAGTDGQPAADRASDTSGSTATSADGTIPDGTIPDGADSPTAEPATAEPATGEQGSEVFSTVRPAGDVGEGRRGGGGRRPRIGRMPSRHPVTTVPSPPSRASSAAGDESDIRAVLRIPEFRRMWIQLSLSSLGDWMGLLATTALVAQLQNSFSGQAYAIGSLLIVRLMPALILGPLAGALADRLDRRMTMVVTDVIRFGLFVSIPLIGTLEWLLIASFLVEAVTLVWAPAKDASVPHLVPRERLAAANTLSLIMTYGTAPLAAAIFTLLATISRTLGSSVSFFRDSSVDLALYFNAATFLGSAIVIWGLKNIGRAARPDTGPEPGFLASITEGWRFVGQDRLVRGLVVGILGGFAGAGCVIALGRLYVGILGGGDSAYGILFGAVFVGLAGGMAAGPKLLGDYSRTRLFGVCVTGAGITLVIVAIIPNLVIACILVVAVGAFAGVAWVTGYTLLQAEVSDELRGRTFALVQSLVRVDLLLVLAVAPALVGLIGSHGIHLWGDITVRADGVTVVLLGGGLLAVAVGLFAYRQMDERVGVAVWPELWSALRGRKPAPTRPRHSGLFVAVEGAEGAGRSTQVELLRSWLAASGREVVVTSGSGATATGARLRELLFDPSAHLHPRTEALLAAADRAEHVSRVIEPALARGAIVITDRYVDSWVAFQCASRSVDAAELAVLAQWATQALIPDLTVLLDLPAELALPPETGVTPQFLAGEHDGARAHADADPATATATDAAINGIGGKPGVEPGRGSGDRSGEEIGAEVLAYRRRVRDGFRRLAQEEPARYLTVDATRPRDEIHAEVRAIVAGRVKRRAAPLGA